MRVPAARRQSAGPKTRRPLPLTEPVARPAGYTPRRRGGLVGYERVLLRAGFGPVAGIDEAGRGACAGPLVVAAVAMDRLGGARWADVADSKALTARARETAYQRIVRSALAWHVVVIGPDEIDSRGLHACNVAGMRRAVAGLATPPGYVLTDGFSVPGLAVPALAMWKADQVAVCVAAASIVAKVTRDRIMCGLGRQYPEYGFGRHKGYSTPSHMAALDASGPSPVHRRSFVNVSRRLGEVWPARGSGELGQLDEPGEAGRLDELGNIAPAGSVALDWRRDGPIVELTAGSLATPPGGEAGPLAWAPASSEGRT